MPENLNISVILPELVLVIFAMLVMVADMFGRDDRTEGAPTGSRALIPWLALIGVAVAAFVCAGQLGQPALTFQGAAISDHFALGLRFIILIATGLGILLSVSYIPLINRQVGEYYALLLLCAAGMAMMGSATDLMVVFIALEILSLALYILCGLHRENPRSSEASMKYFLLGAFASAFFVYGAALVYGAAGSTQYDAIAATLAAGNGQLELLYPGIALLLVGFGFKVSLVPFHMWTPDVYQGAPTPVTAFMSVGTKAAAFAAFIRVLVVALPAQQPSWGWALAILAIITMTLGTKRYLEIKDLAVERIMERIPDALPLIHDYTEEAMDINTMLRTKLSGLTPEEFEGMLRPAFEEDEWQLIALGAVLGFLVGWAQLAITFGGSLF